MYRNIQKYTYVTLFYTSYSLMPHAIHERCIALLINRLWLSMFVLQETVCCSLYNAWYSGYMSFQISSTVFINLKVCLSLQRDYMRLFFFFTTRDGNLFHLHLPSALLSNMSGSSAKTHGNALSCIPPDISIFGLWSTSDCFQSNHLWSFERRWWGPGSRESDEALMKYSWGNLHKGEFLHARQVQWWR